VGRVTNAYASGRVAYYKKTVLISSKATFAITTMTSPVKLYVYDLSRGMARAMSMQFLGRQIDGIWYSPTFESSCEHHLTRSLRHTSVVVFNKEVFYGQGIFITAPGQSHVCLVVIGIQVSPADSDTLTVWSTGIGSRDGRDGH
jgi:hypothetical protein